MRNHSQPASEYKLQNANLWAGSTYLLQPADDGTRINLPNDYAVGNPKRLAKDHDVSGLNFLMN